MEKSFNNLILDNHSYLNIKKDKENYIFYKDEFYIELTEKNYELSINRESCLLKKDKIKVNLKRQRNPYLFLANKSEVEVVKNLLLNKNLETSEENMFFILGKQIYFNVLEKDKIEQLKKDIIYFQNQKFFEVKNNINIKTNKRIIEDHILINSENLIALQALEQLKNQIDCIIIDPPYNTNNKNMKYNDCFIDDKDWVEFMRNRLNLSKDLLSNDGLIFIHINDDEYANLKLLMDNIFVKENFIENFIWEKNSIKNNSKTTANNHEYILCFAKNKKQIEKLNYFRKRKEGFEEILNLKNAIINEELNKLNLKSLEDLNQKQKENLKNKIEQEIKKIYKENKTLKGISQYKFVEEDSLEIFRISDVSAPNKNGNFYEIIHPITKKICKNPSGGYRYNEEKIKFILENNLFYFGKDEKTVPQFKRYLKDMEYEVYNSVIKNFDEGYKDLIKILPNVDFNNPKPVSLIKNLLQMVNKKEFMVLDFFAGSGTIIEAVEEINLQENKNIKCIAITSNENNICLDITKKRFEKTLKSKEKNINFNYYEI